MKTMNDRVREKRFSSSGGQNPFGFAKRPEKKGAEAT